MTIDFGLILKSAFENAWPFISLIALVFIAKGFLWKGKTRSKAKRTTRAKQPGWQRLRNSSTGSRQGAESKIGLGAGSAEATNSENAEQSLSQQLIGKGGAYIPKRRFMSPSEEKFYKKLLAEYGEENYVFSQVRLLDVVEPDFSKYPRDTREYWALFRQISQWHVDFVIVDKNSYQITCIIELDDPSHERIDRKRRDEIWNKLMNDSGVVFYRSFFCE